MKTSIEHYGKLHIIFPENQKNGIVKRFFLSLPEAQLVQKSQSHRLNVLDF